MASDVDVINYVDFQDEDTRSGRKKQIETGNFGQDFRIFRIDRFLS
jgi:hypothetical protein